MPSFRVTFIDRDGWEFEKEITCDSAAIAMATARQMIRDDQTEVTREDGTMEWTRGSHIRFVRVEANAKEAFKDNLRAEGIIA